jgi:2-amino-4-hydroxy-6-hydroxymethyldihydropteridine diphosphokinase
VILNQQNKMNRVFLLTGSNLGESVQLLKRAESAVAKTLGKAVRVSHVYSSESWGYESNSTFFNQCIELESKLRPQEILEKILKIENVMGRIRIANTYADRIIDIDILFYGSEIIDNENLIIPHPRIHLRKFALVPMEEIAGNFVHPVFKKTILELLEFCTDDSKVIRLAEGHKA